jgi:hypothetical protein
MNHVMRLLAPMDEAKFAKLPFQTLMRGGGCISGDGCGHEPFFPPRGVS